MVSYLYTNNIVCTIEIISISILRSRPPLRRTWCLFYTCYVYVLVVLDQAQTSSSEPTPFALVSLASVV